MRIRTVRILLLLLPVWMIPWLGCGGSSSTGEKMADDGRVYMTNLSREHIRASYFVDEETGEWVVEVEPDQEHIEISKGNVAGGTVIKFKLDAFHPCSGAKIYVPVTIDGNVTIRVTNAPCQGAQIDYEITGG